MSGWQQKRANGQAHKEASNVAGFLFFSSAQSK
jgi:hypothetical protein